MSQITIIRAQGSGALEPVVPGESIVVQPGDRIVCDIPFAEAASIQRLGNDLQITLHGTTSTELKQFFSTATGAIQSVIQFQDQELTVDDLNKLLSIKFSVTDASGSEHSILMIAGSVVMAHAGDLFHLNSQEFAIKDLHRQGDDLIIKEHDATTVSAILRGFFIAPHDGAEPPKLQLTNPKLGTAQDMIIHPRAAVFQWQGEPLPQAIVGALYGYYFQLQGKDAENFTLVAKTEEGALPPWLTFASLGAGKFFLSGMPPADAVGGQNISISAHSIAQGVGLHTQQSYYLAVSTESDWITRATTNEVAAAEFRKAGESFETDNYVSNITNVDQMPYMTMPEIAALTSLVSVNQVALLQTFSNYSTAEEVASVRALESQNNNTSETPFLQLPHTSTDMLISGHGVIVAPEKATQVISPIIPVAPAQSTGEQQAASTTPTTESQAGAPTPPPPPATTGTESSIVPAPTPESHVTFFSLILQPPPSPPPSYSAAPVFAPGEYAISENSPNGTTVGTVSATDPDPGDVLTYSIYNGITAFSINPNTGVISVADMSQLDYETTHSFMLGVQVDDLGGNHVQTLVGIYLGNVNDNAPVVDLNGAASGNNFSVNYTVGAVNLAAPTATVTDADAPDYPNLQSITITITNVADGSHEVLSYSFIDSNSVLQSGTSNSGVLTFTGPESLADMQTFLQNVNYTDTALNPTAGDRIITIQADDGMNLSNVATTTVTIGADTPPNISPQTFAIDENSINTTTVGTVVASDPDIGDSITNYSIIGGTGSTAFTIDSLTGVISVQNSGQLDYEVTPSFTLDVQVTDTHGVMSDALMTINLNNLNDNAPMIDLNGPAAGSDFAVNFSGVTNLAAATATITDADAPGFSNIQSITVTLTNAADGANEVLSYSFVDSSEVLQSGSSTSGVLTFTGPESLADIQAFIQSVTFNDTALNPTAGDRIITFQANDGVNLSNVATTTVTIGADTPPNISPQTFAIDENSINTTTVGTVVASDPDIGDSITNYSIIGGTGSTAFTIDSLTGVISVQNSGQLNYEVTTSFTLDVQVTDTHGVMSDALMTINLNNLNDNAPVIDLNGPAVGVDFATNFVGGGINPAANTATITDADAPGFSNIQSITVTLTNAADGANEVLSYSFVDSSSVLQSGSSTSGVLTFTGPESLADIQAFIRSVVYNDTATNPTTGDRTITFQADDGANLSNIATSTVTISANNPPNISPQTFAIDENSSNNTTTGVVVASDPDAGDYITQYSIIGGTGSSAFTIDGTGGVIYVLNSTLLNYEVTTSFTLDVQVTDSHGAMSDAIITINLNNLNDVAPVVDLNGPSAGTDVTVNNLGVTHIAASSATITDADAPGFPNLQSVTVTITNVLDAGNEVLSYSFTDSNNVLETGSSSTGVLTLTGPLSLADMQAFLQSVTYQDTAAVPNTADRIITVVANDGINSSNIATANLTHGFTFSDLNGSNGLLFTGSAGQANGFSVTSVDINGDGYNDVVIANWSIGGAFPNGFEQTDVLLGGPNISSVGSGGIIMAADLNGSNGFIINQNNTVVAVGGAGDINGDGIQDLLIGSAYNFGGYAVFGAHNIGSTGQINITNMDGSQGFNFTGSYTHVVGSAGDFNGDGFQDFFIGFPFTNSFGGTAVVIFGSPTVNASNVVDIASLNGGKGFEFAGNNSSFSGYTMSSAGDINNDGYEDIIIGSVNTNKDFVIFGGPTVGQSGVMHPSDLNGTNGFVITNSNMPGGPTFGHTVANIGDVNGDGIADLLITYPGGQYGTAGPDGAVYVVFGGTGLGSSGTFDLANLTSATGATFFNFSAPVNGDAKGGKGAAIGDVNGDGLQDFAFSATDRVTGLQKLYVIFGSTTLGSESSDLNNLTPSQGFVVYTTDSHQLITSITALGDVNGDGIGDFAVGIAFSQVNGYRSGETAIVFGGDFTHAISQLGTANGETINGTSGDDRIFAAQGNDTVYGGLGNDYINGGSGDDILYGGDGNNTLIGGTGNDTLIGGINNDLLIGGPGADTIQGGAGNDTVVYENNENTLVDGGSGTDTLWIRDGGIAADLHGGNAVDLRGTSIYSNFEVINLQGDTLAPNSVTLDIATVLSMTDAAHTLTIIGTSRDTVGLEPGQFTDIGSFVTSFGTVERYTGGGATIDVLMGINVSQVSTLNLGAASLDYQTTFTGVLVSLADLNATLTDLDGNITQVLVRITNLQDGALESLTATATGNITVTYSPTGVLMLSGNDTPANYLTVLKSILYNDTSATPNTVDRHITFEVSDTGGVSHIATTTVAMDVGPHNLVLSSLMDGVQGFNLTSTSTVFPINATIVQHGDGFGDLLGANSSIGGIAAPYTRAFLIPGQVAFNPSAPLDDPSVSLTVFNNDNNNTPVDAYATQVISSGDFNGDGVNDLLLQAIYGGPSYIVFGSASGFPSTVNLSSADSIVLQGSYGFSGAALGDVNGDGLSDVIIHNPRTIDVVVFGTSAAVPSIDTTTLTGSDGFQISLPGSYLNTSIIAVAGANFTGDGHNDIFVSYYETTGGIAVILGSTPVFNSTVIIDPTSATPISGANGFLITNSTGVPGSNDFLINPTDIGNFNGSGIDSIALSSQNTVYVIFGSSAFLTATSFDVGTQLNGATGGFELTSPTTAHITSIAYVSDVNGDGLPDFAFVDSAADGGLGAIYVIFGSTSPFAANIDYTNLTANEGFVITDPTGVLANATLGGGGDLNGDGLGDIVITSGGQEYIVFGANFNGVITQLGGSAGGTIIGAPGNEVIYAGNADNQTIIPGSSTNFINTGVGTDTIDGTVNNGNNTIVYSPYDVTINAGSGSNTLWFEHDSQSVSFIGNTNYTGLNTINLHAIQTLSGNSVTLDPAAVLSMSNGNLLIINGDAYDSVHLRSDGFDFWAQTGSIPGYNVWVSTSGSTVEIATSINKISVFNIGPLTINDQNLNGVNGVNIASPTSGETTNPGFATSLALMAANASGDGFADLAIETPFGQPVGIGYGQVFLLHGTTLASTGGSITLDTGVNTGMVYSSTQRFATANISNPGSSYSKFGINFVGDVGSFTGAGTHDLLIATNTPFGFANPGTEYIVFGPLSSITSAQDITSMVTSGSAMAITGAGYLTGAGLGDINGDGLADVGVHLGWVYNVSDTVNASKLFILFGASSPPPAGTNLDILNLNGTNGGFIISNDHVNSTSSITQLVGVNLNGDAFNDIVYQYHNIWSVDIVNVVFGSSTLGTSNVDGTTLATTMGSGVQFINGTETADNGFGTYMANIGNFTGNGYDSLALADPSNGTVYVVYGGAAFTTQSGQFDVATMTVNQGFTVTVPVGDTITGLSYLGDVNGDGMPDLAISVLTSGGLGEAFVVFGSDNPFPSTMSAVATDASHGFTILNYAAGNVATPIQSLVGGADLNGDGLSDIVISNFYSNPGVHVVFGSNFSSVITQTGGSTPGTITGNLGNEVIYAGSADQMIIPNSGTNFIDTGTGHDVINGLTHNGTNTIVYSAFDNAANQIQAGLNHNTLWFEHDGNNVNLVGTSIFSGFDEINLQALQTLTGNSLTLDAAEVNSMSNGNALVVKGNAQDSLTLTSSGGGDTWSLLSATTLTSTYASALTHSHVTVDNSMVNAGHVHII